MEQLIKRYDNPAKRFLRRYRALLAQQASLQRSIEAAYERAYSCTARLKPIAVQGGNGAYDRMAEDIAIAADETAQLAETAQEVRKALHDVLEAISAVPDETQKAVLMLRYVEGLSWIAIQEKLNYERTQTLIIHGKALLFINKWMEENKNE